MSDDPLKATVEQHAQEITELKTRASAVEKDVEELQGVVKGITDTLHRIEVSSTKELGEIKLAISTSLHKALDSIPVAFAKRRDMWRDVITIAILAATLGVMWWHG